MWDLSKFSTIIKTLTVEPLVFTYLVAWILQCTLTTNLLYDKVCEQSENGTNCQNESSLSRQKQDKVQIIVSQYNMYLNIIQTLPSIVFVLFVGSWSDLNGRKIPLVMPLLGSMFATLICLINAYVWWLHPTHILVSGIPRALTGGSKSFMMAIYSYIIDISSAEHRTTRIAFVDLMFIIAPPLAYYLSDTLFKSIGYVGVYAVSSVLLLLCAIYVIFFLKETKGPFAYEHMSTESNEDSRKYSSLFNTDHFKETVSVVIKKRRNRTKILVLMSLICLMNIRSAIYGLDFLYVKKILSWNYSQFILWNIVYFFSLAFGESVVLPIFSSCLNIEEYILGGIGSISRIACSAIQGFAYFSWHLYAAAGVGFLAEIPASVARSKISKISIPEDIGKTFSMLASWESIVPLIASPIYTFTYNATIDLFPGAIYMIDVVIFAFTGVILFIMYFQTIMENKTNYEEKSECSKSARRLLYSP